MFYHGYAAACYHKYFLGCRNMEKHDSQCVKTVKRVCMQTTLVFLLDGSVLGKRPKKNLLLLVRGVDPSFCSSHHCHSLITLLKISS